MANRTEAKITAGSPPPIPQTVVVPHDNVTEETPRVKVQLSEHDAEPARTTRLRHKGPVMTFTPG
ncbi:hypothetical protein ACTWPT_21840 [Nonomuraea sp. 3N208]|uniref:hypothetical protein n=1 Tax=Nonomuraea sp. 3N208 TaxID=3457421 RepID=UPI003FCD0C2F